MKDVLGVEYGDVTPYDELTFSNDFIFTKVLQTNEHLCRHLIEIILDIKVSQIVIEKQKEYGATADSRGIRLDVWVKDEDGCIYDIEMQAVKKPNLPKRSRYYQSMVDLDMLSRGVYYDKLAKSYIIFICLNDVFDSKLCKYTFVRMCLEDGQTLLGDGSNIVFLNASGKMDGVSDELKQFLEYLLKGIPTDDFTSDIETQVKAARLKKEWRSEYMTTAMKEREKYEEGKLDGIQEGENNGIDKTRELFKLLVSAGKMDDIKRASDDKVFFMQLLKDYDLA